jgi:hypothetical protein
MVSSTDLSSFISTNAILPRLFKFSFNSKLFNSNSSENVDRLVDLVEKVLLDNFV